MWVGSDTNTADRSPRSPQLAGDRAQRIERVVRLVLAEDRRRRDAVRDRVRRGRRPPRSCGRRAACRRSRRTRGATPACHRSTACSSRASNTGDGRPSYWAAPSTTIASAGRCSSRSPCCQIRTDGERADERRPPRPATMIRRTRSLAAPGASGPVTLLVLLARAAPARVVAADPRAGRREARAGRRRSRAASPGASRAVRIGSAGRPRSLPRRGRRRTPAARSAACAARRAAPKRPRRAAAARRRSVPLPAPRRAPGRGGRRRRVRSGAAGRLAGAGQRHRRRLALAR